MSSTNPDPQIQKANLARIRDNQRRSRARRKEYLQELETKYRTCEAVGVEASSEIQTAARRVLDENKRLRALLKRQGLTDVEIDGCDSSTDIENPQFPLASNVLKHLLSVPRECKPGSCSDEHSTRKQSCVSNTPSWVANNEEPASPPQILPRHVSTHQQPQQQHQQPQQQQFQQIQPFNNANNVSPTHHRSHSRTHSDHSYLSDHQVYQPQHNSYPYMYPLDGHVGDDSIIVAEHNNINTSMPAWHHSQPHLGSPQYMPGAVPTTELHPDSLTDHTSTSCSVAAEAIRSYSSHAGPEVERALGCHDSRDSTRCHVNNSVVFGLMDQYDAAAAAGEGLR